VGSFGFVCFIGGFEIMDNSWHYVKDNCCPVCGGRLKEYIDMVVCENCTYNELRTEKYPPSVTMEQIKNLYEGHLVNTEVFGSWDIQPNTLQINCELIKITHKELDIEFEFNTKKLENIDTIEINGHRFVREK
jgi:hypothetical protein